MKNKLLLFLLVLFAGSEASAQLFGGHIITQKTGLAPLPAGITLQPIGDYFIASVYDQDYLPFTFPTSAATLATPVAADGTTDATTVNVQGTLTTTGVSISIPYTVTGASVSLPAYSQTVNVPASFTEDGIARDITFSYPAQTLAVGSGTITATLKSVGGILNAKKLDIQTGIGSDVLGWLMAQFTYATNSSGGTDGFAVRDIAGIPDKMFGVADNTGSTTSHQFLYLPKMAEDGNIWLSNNLGAEYANVTSGSFNLAAQATSATDFRAYGSLIQWGRKPDGHELINWTASTSGTPVNGSTAIRADIPSHASFITSASTFDWRQNPDALLWDTATSLNNPCPVGFRVPDVSEFNNLLTVAKITSLATASTSSLRFSATGFRDYSNAGITSPGLLGYNSSKTAGSTTNHSWTLELYNTAATSQKARSFGFPVRCIKDNTPLATLTLNCAGKTDAGTLAAGTAYTDASGVTTTIPYTGWTTGVIYPVASASTGVTGLTATVQDATISTTGNLTVVITGTPSAVGTASFVLNVGGSTCTFTRTVSAPANTVGLGTFSGKTCFDIAESNNDTNACGTLVSRLPNKSNFSLVADNTQSYTFTPSGTVSNVRFVYVNTNGSVITAISGNNSGNNISTPVIATASYATNLNTTALGLTNSNPFTADIYVIYNDGATNNGTDRQLKLTSNVKDCTCCGAFVSPGVWKAFLCHNLGADPSLNPDVPVAGIQGAYIQWGKRGPNTTGDSRVDWQTAASSGSLGFAAAPTSLNANALLVTGWSGTAATDNAWRTAGGAKTANDPCPAGYRVPTQAEWSGVNTNNTVSRTGVSWVTSDTNYGSALHYGPNASYKQLTLPASGSRSGSNGATAFRGNSGAYWSSTENGTTTSRSFIFTQTAVSATSSPLRTVGYNVRCIAE